MGRNNRRRKQREVHCGPTCIYCRDPKLLLGDEPDDDNEFGPDEWTYGPDGEIVDES